jgi:Cytochrome c554 and c-prime
LLVLIGTTARLFADGIPCAQCHPKEVAGFAATPMGRSLSAPPRVPAGEYIHLASGSQFTVEWNGSRMIQRIERGGVRAQYEIPYAVGSGTHAFAYLVEISGHLFESPLGYFPGRGWDMSPGYEHDRAPDFYRPVTPDCLFCHAGSVRAVPEAFNTYQEPPFGAQAITCERCHGPADAHLHAPLPGSVINPAKLAPPARDSICEQCHLIGEERVANPGKQLSDFRPGDNLEEVFAVYVSAGSKDSAHPVGLRVVSQVQQLALSDCARKSKEKLWCGTCHDPHQQPLSPAVYFRARCLECHGESLVKRHPKPSENCVGCHMPRRPVTDGAHTTFTDHRIAVYPSRELAEPASAPADAGNRVPASLVAWRDPAGALAQRDLGLAEVRVGDRLESFDLVNQGFQILMNCWDPFPNDPAVLTGIGKALLAANHGPEAAAAFEQAVQLEPKVAVRYLNAALAWKAAHQDQKAIDDLEKTLQLDPLLEQPYLELVSIYGAEHDREMMRRTLERYLHAFPRSVRAQMAVRGDVSKDRPIQGAK